MSENLNSSYINSNNRNKIENNNNIRSTTNVNKKIIFNDKYINKVRDKKLKMNKHLILTNINYKLKYILNQYLLD
jgi:hypothetical protein